MNKNTNRTILTALVFVLFLSAVASLASADDAVVVVNETGGAVAAGSQADILAIMQRLERLEQENAALRNELGDLRGEVQTYQQQEASQPVAVLTGTKKPAVTAKYPIKLYGYVKADAVYGDSQVGDLSLSAPLEGTTVDNDEFNMTASESRIGLDLTGPTIGYNGKTEGKIEGDFWGGTFRIRQAYVKLKYISWDVLAGQTWDFFSPLYPSTLNFAVMWRSGNLGDRHPQLTLTKRFEKVLGAPLTTQVGIIDSREAEQEDRALPLFGMYNTMERKIFGKPVQIGFGGLIGQTDRSTTAHKDATIWAATASLKLTLSQWFSIKGEGYVGAGLKAFRGCSPTTVTGDKAVRGRGGWMQLTFQPNEKMEFNSGVGIDDVYTDPVSSTGSDAVWDYNFSYFTNMKVHLTKDVDWGLEFQHFNTKYKQQAGGDANRYQTSLIYKF